VVLSDEAGNIPLTEVRVHEGGYARPPGRYDLCFRWTGQTSPEVIANPVSLTIGDAGGTTSTTAPTTPTTAPTTTTTAPTTPTTVSPSGNVCHVTATSGDQSVVAAAVRACPNGTASSPTRVSFPLNATFNATGPIRVDDRQHLVIDGNGSTFNTSANQNLVGNGNWVILRGVNVTLEDMVVRGAFDLRPRNCGPTWSPNCLVYSTARYPAGVGWEPNGGFAFFGTNGGGVRDARVYDVWGDGVLTSVDGILDGNVPCPPPENAAWVPCQWQVARNLVIERILVDNASRVCTASTQGVNITYRNSTFRNCWTGAMDHEADGDADGNLHNALVIDGIYILNNVFEGYSYGAIAVPVGGDIWQPNPEDRTPVRNIVIKGNEFRTGPELAPCQPSNLIGVDIYGSRNRIQNLTVEDNTIKGLTRFVVVNHVDTGSIQRNTFVHRSYGTDPPDPKIQCSPTSANPVAPVVVYDSTNVTVTGNVGP
jgi:hypothetical protein